MVLAPHLPQYAKNSMLGGMMGVAGSAGSDPLRKEFGGVTYFSNSLKTKCLHHPDCAKYVIAAKKPCVVCITRKPIVCPCPTLVGRRMCSHI